MKSNKYIVLILILFSSKVFASQLDEEIEKKAREFRLWIEKVKQIEPINFLRDIEDPKKMANEVIKSHTILCEDGLISEGGVDGPKYLKLSKEEQVLCFKQLITLRKDYVEGLYEARVKHLNNLHESQLEWLKSERDESLKIIQPLEYKIGF